MNNLIDKYTYSVQWSQEYNTHIAKCLEFPSLSADGATCEKALREIKKVVEESVKWLEEDGESPPEPFGMKNFSGNVTLRMPKEIHKKIAINAAEEGTSINQYVLSKISS